MNGLEERAEALMILDARRALHARRHADAEGTHARDRPRAVGIDKARAVGPEHEAERPCARVDGGVRVVNARDPADLHEHAGTLMNTKDTEDTKAARRGVARRPAGPADQPCGDDPPK